MEVVEGLRKWAILRVGLPPVGDTINSLLSSRMASGDSAIVAVSEEEEEEGFCGSSYRPCNQLKGLTGHGKLMPVAKVVSLGTDESLKLYTSMTSKSS